MEKAAGSGGGSSDFVKKLYKMLEDPTYRHIVRWSDTGDSFIVLDNTEFTKNVLPRHFKHSNFASFVRQLNKYDFHKIRNTEETSGSPYGEQAWEFKHPNFLMYNRDQLENIKRKAPAARKAAQQRATNDDGPAVQAAVTQIEQLQGQLKVLKGAQKGMDEQLERNDTMCQQLVSQVRDMHKKLIEYEDLIQSLIERLSLKELESQGRVSHARSAYTSGREANEQAKRDGNDSNQDEDDEDMEDYDEEDEDEVYGDYSTPQNSQGLPKSSPYKFPFSPGFNYDPMETNDDKSNSMRQSIYDTNQSPGQLDSSHTEQDGYGTRKNTLRNILANSPYTDGQTNRKLPDLLPSIKSARSPSNMDAVSEPPTPSPSLHPPQSASHTTSAFSPGGSQNQTDRSELLEVMNVNMYSTTTDNLLLSQPGSTLPPRLSTIKEKDHTVKDLTQGAPVNKLHLPPMQLSNMPHISLPSLSDVKQELGITENQHYEKGKARPSDDPAANGGRPWPILIVDDDQNVREILRRFFQSMKLDVDMADNGLTAVEKNTQNRYSMIYMDIIMPLLDGVSATRLIRKTDKTTPIICIASNSSESDYGVYYRCGVTGILAKPFGKKKIFASMMEHMSRFPGWSPPKKRSRRLREDQGENEGTNNQENAPRGDAEMGDLGGPRPNDNEQPLNTASTATLGATQNDPSSQSRRNTSDPHAGYGGHNGNPFSPDPGMDQKAQGNNASYLHSIERHSASHMATALGDSIHAQRQNSHHISKTGPSTSYGHGGLKRASSFISQGASPLTQSENQYHTVSGITPPGFGHHMGDHDAAPENRRIRKAIGQSPYHNIGSPEQNNPLPTPPSAPLYPAMINFEYNNSVHHRLDTIPSQYQKSMMEQHGSGRTGDTPNTIL